MSRNNAVDLLVSPAVAQRMVGEIFSDHYHGVPVYWDNIEDLGCWYGIRIGVLPGLADDHIGIRDCRGVRYTINLATGRMCVRVPPDMEMCADVAE